MINPIPEQKIWELLGWPQDVAPNSMYMTAFAPMVKLVRDVEHFHEQAQEKE